MDSIRLVIVGQPVAQGRPRFARRGSFVATYDPIKSKDYKAEVAKQAIEQIGTDATLDGALRITLVFRMARPKYIPRRVKFHIKKPDIDNLVKSIKDALKGVCYHDDSQVVNLKATKVYVSEGSLPSVLVIISKIENTELSVFKQQSIVACPECKTRMALSICPTCHYTKSSNN